MSFILQLSSNVLFLKNNKISRVDPNDLTSICSDNYQFLTAEFPDTGNLGGFQSQALFYYLKFLYSRKQGESAETRSALQLLKQTVKGERDKSKNGPMFMSSYELLLKAFELSNDSEGIELCSFEILKAIKMSDKFDIFMKYAQRDEEMAMLFGL